VVRADDDRAERVDARGVGERGLFAGVQYAVGVEVEVDGPPAQARVARRPHAVGVHVVPDGALERAEAGGVEVAEV